jgi:hypothetical protein
MRTRLAAVAALLLFLAGAGIGAGGPASAQTLTPQSTTPVNLKPTDKCPQPDVDQLQRVIRFVQDQSWSQHPGSTAFLLNPDTAACRVVLKINKVSNVEQAALERGGEGRLSIQKTKDYAKPSRLPLILWVIFGGAGVVFVFIRYGRR